MAEAGSGDGERSRTVAVTRSVEDNRIMAKRLVGLGFAVVDIPLIEVVGPADGGRGLRDALADLARYRWVVLTSTNGVRAVVDARGSVPWPRRVSVAAVGPVTAALARSAGLPVDLVPDEATAATLVEAFPMAEGSGASVLAPLAELASDTIASGLGSKGWRVDRVEAYRTTAPTDERPVDATGLDAVTLFSPSVVDRWVHRCGPDVPLAVCVGPSTAARAKKRGLVRVVVAKPHTEDGVIAALDEILTRPSRPSLP